jgi:indoleamine 2,3-dioxygenase
MSNSIIDPERGFLPNPDPLDHLPAAFAPWEEIGRNLPKLLTAGNLRSAVQDLPVLDAGKLTSEPEQQRAMVILSFAGHGYVWGEAQVVEKIPPPLAIPWHQLAEMLGRPPVLSYASYALENWRRMDREKPIELGNLVLLQNFLGGIDEEWFVIVHVAIEAQAAPALHGLIHAQEAVGRDDSAETERHLTRVAAALETMHQILLRMPERCDPYIYYHRVRPYLHGWRNHPSLPNGILYEDVEAYGGAPQQFRGETGAQSSIVPSLDAGLGITHQEDVLYTYLREMRDYMPPAHRRFIERLQEGPSIRRYVVQHRQDTPQLRDAYNGCIELLERFRSTHVGYAENYIQKQSRREGKNPTDVGTGGTPFMPYLRKHRNETGKHLIR